MFSVTIGAGCAIIIAFIYQTQLKGEQHEENILCPPNERFPIQRFRVPDLLGRLGKLWKMLDQLLAEYGHKRTLALTCKQMYRGICL
jgi:hypothetical protein